MRKDWELKKLDEVCEVEYGTRVVRKRDAGTKFPVYGGGGETFKLDSSNRANQLIVARFAMSEQCTRYVEGDFFLNDSGLTVSADGKGLWQRFLDCQILSLNNEIYSLGRGTAQKNLDVKAFRNLRLVVPSVFEQKEIVRILDEAFAGIDKAREVTKKNLKNSHELFDSYLNNIFTIKGKDWEEKKLDEVCQKIQDGAHTSPQTLYPEPAPSLFPYLTSKNIRTGYLKLDNLQYCDANFHNMIYPRCNPELGDVLLTKDGANTGNIAINTLDEPFSLLSSVCLLKPDSLIIESKFLCYYLQSKDGFEQMTSQMTGAAIKRIILKTIKSSVISFPSLSEQNCIIEKLDALLKETQQLEAIYEKKLNDLDELKKSILEKAFSGELTKDFTNEKVSG